MVTIDKITIKTEHDDTGCSEDYIGTYSQTPGPDDRTIDRQARGDQRRGEYRYFIAAMSGNETGNPESVEQDYRRSEALNRGEWGYLGVWCVAEVSYAQGGPVRRIECLRSSGLWGIETDSGPECLLSIARDELHDLRTHLAHFGVDLSNFDALAAKALEHFEP